MIRIQLETGPRRVAVAKTGTREQARELALAYIISVANSHGDRAEERSQAQRKFIGEEGSLLHHDVGGAQHCCRIRRGRWSEGF